MFELRPHVRVADSRRARTKTQANGANDESPRVYALETARPIREAALLRSQRSALGVAAIVDVDALDGLRHVLSVGADVLNRRAADGPRDAREAFDAREPS